MAKKKKENKKFWLKWGIPAIVIIAVFWVISLVMAPTVIDTSEGIALLKGKTVERAIVNDGTQQVKLELSKKYTPKNLGKDAQMIPQGATKEVTFTFVQSQAEQVNELIQDGNLKKGYNSIFPTGSWWSALLQMMIPLLLFFALIWWAMSRMQGGGMMGFKSDQSFLSRRGGEPMKR